jgi:subtilisin family serine protease
MKTKKLTLAALISTLVLTGCGGGSSGTSDPVAVPPTQNPDPDPEIVVPNATAKAMINATESLVGTNVVIAVADSGVYSGHNEFAGTRIDARSGSYASEFVQMEWPAARYDLIEMEDDYFPDYSVSKDYFAAAHGTHVSSLIFGETAGILSDGTLLALDVVYEGKHADGSLDPIGSRPDVIASILATTELAKTAQIDFLNLSMEYAGTYFNENTDRGTERAVHESTKGGGIGVIVAAGNEGLDYSEIYASNTPACTEAEWDEASVSERARCYALEFDRKKLDLAIYHNDSLRKNYIMVASVNDDRTIAGNSNKPGDHQKIQERFIAAPGVNLDVASHKVADGFTKNTGTSFAAPLVTAAAGAVKSKFTSLSSAAVLQILLDTADRSFNGYNPADHGMGILNVEAALNVNPVDYIGIN